ncbi:uncharacterized protein BX664DRAFT_334011 [Halteromyces radiatus]|uniref:uncharacterized protein n=1 Tax=Halteromyces radiatus TaxID=101107 RepID=UPI00221E6A66|nr:uncharacterized protein BX664DRAFT_334011 [Halteromyces radiatus]KAI8089830.1 hypothetical protein BX664DRAFT_334011 [Halteromyces radiatus]
MLPGKKSRRSSVLFVPNKRIKQLNTNLQDTIVTTTISSSNQVNNTTSEHHSHNRSTTNDITRSDYSLDSLLDQDKGLIEIDTCSSSSPLIDLTLDDTSNKPTNDMSPSPASASNPKSTSSKTSASRRRIKKRVLVANRKVQTAASLLSPPSQLPDYESLTLPELRNALKKYGFKSKDRKSMITTLKNLQLSLGNDDPSSSTSRLLSSVSSSIPASSSSIPASSLPHSASTPDTPLSLESRTKNRPCEDEAVRQELLQYIKSNSKIWESILRYESVDLEKCAEGLPREKKKALLEFLDENALIFKPPKSR